MLIANPFKARIHTLKKFLQYFLGINSLFIVFGVISLDRILNIGASEPFRLGNVVIPKFVVGGSNLSVFLLCITGTLLVSSVLLYRYFYYKKVIKKLRDAGIYDFDGDGKIDTFLDDFLDDNFN